MTDSTIPVRDAALAPRPGWGADRIGELVFAGLIVALGVYAFVGAFSIRTPVGAHVGPRVFPFLVAGILLIAGAALVVGVLRGRLGAPDESEDTDPNARTDWLTLAKIVVLLLGVIVVLEVLGWPLTAALLFGGVAWALGAKRWWTALLVGLAMGAVTFWVFGLVLGLSLPRGVLLGWLPL